MCVKEDERIIRVVCERGQMEHELCERGRGGREEELRARN